MSMQLRTISLTKSLTPLLKRHNLPQALTRQLQRGPGHEDSSSKPNLALPIAPGKLPILESQANEHVLKDLILKKGPLTLDDLESVLNFVDLDVQVTKAGAVPASTNPESSYINFAWVRDTAVLALAMYELGLVEEAKQLITCFWEFYTSNHENGQRGRLTNFLWDKNPREKYLRGENPWHIRGWIDKESGKIVTSLAHWKHTQPDGLFMLLALTYKMAKEKKLDLGKLDAQLGQHQFGDSIFSLATKVATRIEPYNLTAGGAWEDFDAQNRTSWLAPYVQAMENGKAHFSATNWNLIKISELAELQDAISRGVTEGRKALNTRIPEDGSMAIETDSDSIQRYDSSLVFALLFDPDLNPKQILAIIKTIYDHRLEKVGMSRRDKDRYMGRDYHKVDTKDGIFTTDDIINKEKDPLAGWTFQEAVCAEKLFDLYLDSNGAWEEPFLVAQDFTKRCIAMITSRDYTFHKKFHEGRRDVDITVKARQVPECWFYNSDSGIFFPGENSPLITYGNGCYAKMFHKAILATHLWNARHSKVKQGAVA